MVLQAGVIIGSGSASFEMLRYLTERLPMMVTPQWVRSLVQPIAVRDVLAYLVGALDLDPTTNRRFDIAGPDILSYRDMMQRYAKVAGLTRRSSSRSRCSPRGCRASGSTWSRRCRRRSPSRWSSRCATTWWPREHDIESAHPARPLPLRRGRPARARTHPPGRRRRPGGRVPPGRAHRATRCRPTPNGAAAPPTETTGRSPVDVPVSTTCGGRSRASAATAAGTRSRWPGPSAGLLDRLVGGVGLRRGRRDPDRLAVGDAVDFWRVEAHRAAVRSSGSAPR